MKPNLMIECQNCKYKDLPENFNGFLSYGPNEHPGENGLLVLITLECPVCQSQQFYQHFKVGGEMQVTNPMIAKYTFSHKVYPHSVLTLSISERNKEVEKNIRELHKEYLVNLQREE